MEDSLNESNLDAFTGSAGSSETRSSGGASNQSQRTLNTLQIQANQPTAFAPGLQIASTSEQAAIEVPPINSFVDPTKKNGPTQFGVLKIRNIPYDVTRQEIVHLLGRNPGIIEKNVMGCAVHIIMERPTSKTMDCYVEFKTVEAVNDQIRRHEALVETGRHPKLGNRHIHVELTDQNELLRELFPRAKSIVWREGRPRVIKNRDPYSMGFKGFFTKEEMSPFSINCLQRTYECMISTLYKFPWYATAMYTVADRNLLFDTYMKQMVWLVKKVEQTHTKGLDENLLRDWIFAGLNCPGFGEKQKFAIVTEAGLLGGGVPMSPLACFWPFALVGRNAGLQDEAVEKSLHLIELGAEEVAQTSLVKDHFVVTPRRTPPPPIDNPNFLNITTYEPNEKMENLSYVKAVEIEVQLLQELLTAGAAKEQRRDKLDQGQQAFSHGSTIYPYGGPFGGNQAQIADNMRLLQLQRDEILQGRSASGSARPHVSPPQSPKGTTFAVFDSSSDEESTPKVKKSKPIDPTSEPFEPTARSFNPSIQPFHRTSQPFNPTTKPFEPRQSTMEPQQIFGLVGDVPASSPFGRRGSGHSQLGTSPFDFVVPSQSSSVGTSGSPAKYSTPTRNKSNVSFPAGNIIKEEEDEELYEEINNANILKTR